MRKGRVGRFGRLLVACAAAGLVLSVLSAWGAVLHARYRVARLGSMSGWWEGDRATWLWPDTELAPQAMLTLEIRWPGLIERRAVGEPGSTAGAGPARMTPYPGVATVEQFESRAGWPWPALRSRDRRDPGSPPARSSLEGGIVWEELAGARAGAPDRTRLPVTPILPGLAADVAVWGGLAGLTHAGLGALVRVRRRGRGECPACRYPWRGPGSCPECGTPGEGGAAPVP